MLVWDWEQFLEAFDSISTLQACQSCSSERHFKTLTGDGHFPRAVFTPLATTCSRAEAIKAAYLRQYLLPLRRTLAAEVSQRCAICTWVMEVNRLCPIFAQQGHYQKLSQRVLERLPALNLHKKRILKSKLL